MFEKEKIRKNYWWKDSIIKEIKEELEQENISAEDVLDYILGDKYNISDYTLYKYKNSKISLWNRINMIWFTPIWIITIPFQWLFRGQIGVNKNSKIGKIIDKLINLD